MGFRIVKTQIADEREPVFSSNSGFVRPKNELPKGLVIQVSWGQFPNCIRTLQASIRITVNFFGPCAPSTSTRSISAVRLGPVIKEMKLGQCGACFSLSTA